MDRLSDASPTTSAKRRRCVCAFKLAGFLAPQRYRRRPLERARQFLAAAQIGRRSQEAVYGRLVAEVAGELAALKHRIGELDAEIRDRFLTLPEAPIILSMPGMSYGTGPRFAAEVGTLARFSSPDAPASYAGLTPTVWQSSGSSEQPLSLSPLQPAPASALWSAAIGSL